jgi:hypothetical protein
MPSALDAEIAAALGEMNDFAGETVKIYGDSPGSVYSGTATVTGGAVNFDMVTGGAYQKDSYTMSIRKVDLGTFVPVAGMLVDARGKSLRIPDDGVTDNRAHYRIEIVGRDVPR